MKNKLPILFMAALLALMPACQRPGKGDNDSESSRRDERPRTEATDETGADPRPSQADEQLAQKLEQGDEWYTLVPASSRMKIEFDDVKGNGGETEITVLLVTTVKGFEYNTGSGAQKADITYTAKYEFHGNFEVSGNSLSFSNLKETDAPEIKLRTNMTREAGQLVIGKIRDQQTATNPQQAIIDGLQQKPYLSKLTLIRGILSGDLVNGEMVELLSKGEYDRHAGHKSDAEF